MIESERIHVLNTQPRQEQGSYVVYVMQAAQRVEYNHALEYAIRMANTKNLPLVVYSELIDTYPGENLRHYTFMIEGLREVVVSLKKQGIQTVVHYQKSKQKTTDLLLLSAQAYAVVTDIGYTRFQREWRARYAKKISCEFVGVETNVVIPVAVASQKEEYAAKTIRPKIHKQLTRYLVPLRHSKVKQSSVSLSFHSYDIYSEQVFSDVPFNKEVTSVSRYFSGGTSEAKKWLTLFFQKKLATYADTRNDPSEQSLSCMSPYLHAGQISPLYIALQAHKQAQSAVDVFLEELIVRRELAINFTWFQPNYDSYDCLPDWAKKTLDAHRADTREYVYSQKQFEQAQTHDPYWNAAQREMLITGKMHGYMRMYWGKKILEWAKTPEEAFRIALYLNDTYELDGRDPNGYAGVAWCFGKHDRPWFEREIFGQVRYMNAAGLKRKFAIDAYVAYVHSLTA